MKYELASIKLRADGNKWPYRLKKGGSGGGKKKLSAIYAVFILGHLSICPKIIYLQRLVSWIRTMIF